MKSPLELSREGIERDLAYSFGRTVDRLIFPGQELPTQFDRQLDIVATPPASGGGGGMTQVFPFDVISAGTAGYAVQPGTINGLLPSNYTITQMLGPTNTYYLTLSVTASSGQITGATLSFAASAPAAVPVNMGQPPTSFDYLLGVVIDQVWFRTIGPGSLSAGGNEVFRTDKSSPAPGTLPYDIWYTWLIGIN